jgi:hypothetical protein
MPVNTAINICTTKYGVAVFNHCHSPLIWLHQTHLCFPNLNLKFQVCQFDTRVAIPYNVMEKLHTITEDKFSKCFQSLHICCNKCSYSLWLFSDRWLRNTMPYILPFLLYFSRITLLSHCVNVYSLLLVITEWVSIDKKSILSLQTSLKTNNYMLPEWNGYCRRRDWLLHYYFQVSEFWFKALFCL